MKISYNWLKDYIVIKQPVDKLAHKLTMAGLEVTDYRKTGDDWVLDIEVTSNRPDCLSHIGIAREVAAIYDKKLRLPSIKDIRREKSDQVSVKIENKKDCPLYTARVIDNALVKTSSCHMLNRLGVIGLRGVNSIVDITNYVLLEMGQPLHAFDLDKILNRCKMPIEIIVRRAKKDEKIVTIDGETRQLSCEILVIADRLGPIAIAGVMGGKDSEVDSSTKRLLLESAYFDPITIRTSRQKLGLNTESSYRFERDVNLCGVSKAQERVADLILKTSPKARCSRIFAAAAAKPKNKEVTLKLDCLYVNKLLGTDLAKETIVKILKRLEFSVKTQSKSRLTIKAPDFRKDIEGQEDVIEEIVRISGYDNIGLTLPAIIAKPQQRESVFLDECKRVIKRTLCASGFFEVISYSLESEAKASILSVDGKEIVRIENPLSKEQEVLRLSLLAGLLDVAAYNFNRSIDDVNIFEMGAVFKDTSSKIEESQEMGILAAGKKIDDWYRQACLKEKADFSLFDIKGILETCFLRLGIDIARLDFSPQALTPYENGIGIGVSCQGSSIGHFGKVEDLTLKKWGIRKKNVFLALIGLDKLLAISNLGKSFTKFSVFPTAARDISIIIEKGVRIKTIKDEILKKDIPILKEILLFDEYRGANIPKGSRSLSFSLKFAAFDRTLKEEEINAALEKVKDLLTDRFSAQIR
ncbi:MAG: phenylalanine--tRNA ligase subunit beta [Candidatus Omnitrophica bacterium]|nr:phenylalanine--tRNA ligase subunit beta [Candidatus Omnitrophota bacterium]